MPSSHLIFCRPLLLLPLTPPRIRDFSNESTLRMRWPKYWSFSFSISPSNEYPELISFRLDWLDLLAVQGTLKSLLQHQFKSMNSLVLSFLHSPTLSHPYMIMLVPAYRDFLTVTWEILTKHRAQCQAYNKYSKMIAIIIIVNFENDFMNIKPLEILFYYCLLWQPLRKYIIIIC